MQAALKELREVNERAIENKKRGINRRRSTQGIDAFDFSDTILNSALGRFDGRVYEALYESARRSALNVDRHTGGPIEVPRFFDSVRDYLDADFLRRGRDAAGPAAAAKL